MNRNEAIRIVGVFAAAHPAWKATEATVELWAELLADLPYEQTAQAARRLVSSSAGWPSIAAVRTAVAKDAGLLGPDLDVACRQFLDRASGRAGEVHPLVDDTVRALGGWRLVREAGNVSVLIGQFRALYEPAAARHADTATTETGPLLEQASRLELTA